LWGPELVASYNTHIHHKDNLVSIQKKLAAGEYAVYFGHALGLTFASQMTKMEQARADKLKKLQRDDAVHASLLKHKVGDSWSG
jgi:hypothetical protein